MKKIFLYLLTASALSFSFITYAQQGRNEEILKSVTDYFSLERENIHVHFDKSLFMSNENIWFKGYVFHRKKNVPFFTTVNVYASLIDSDGKILETKLLYGNIGSFSGSFKLGRKFKSGRYYIQFYTNWMNNFTEDESAVYEVGIINTETGAGNVLAHADLSKINIKLAPEGGTMVNGITNNLSIQVSDLNQEPVNVESAELQDQSGKLIQKIPINKMGYGKFLVPPGITQGCKVVVAVNDHKHEKPLPNPEFKGVALEVNSYAFADKTIIKVRSNKVTLDSFGARPIYMLIHQDNKATVLELDIDSKTTEQTIVIPNSDIADGTNTIRILDSDLNQLAERMFFKYPKENLAANLSRTGQKDDKIQLKGKVNYPNMNLSISVLPENTISFDDTNDIYGSLMLLPYLENQKKISGRHYFSTITKAKMYELDLLLTGQKSKYTWRNIIGNAPKNTYSFDMGIALKGATGMQNAKTSKVRLFSITGIDEITDINEKGEFYFDNLVIPDSSYVSLTVIKRGADPKELSAVPQTLNSNKKFNKPYKPAPKFYAANTTEDPAKANIYGEAVELNEVKMEAKTASLKYANTSGNGDLHGYKIGDKDNNASFSLVNFIRTYGNFWVDTKDGLKIQSRTINSINGAQAGPIIYIDDVQLIGDLTWLTNIYLDEVDEIYMNSQKIVPSVRNYMGMIKIYLRKGARPNGKGKTPQIMVKNGFEKMMPFENVTYNSVTDKGFENFGIINWEPTIMTNDKGEFDLTLPNMYDKPLKVLIEGFSADGKLISEVRTIQ